MSNEEVSYSNPGVYQRIEQRLDRIEDKLDTRLTSLDAKVDGLASRQTRMEGELRGSIAMVRWLGPTGLGALIFGVLKASGLL
jgi:hypothetical protein